LGLLVGRFREEAFHFGSNLVSNPPENDLLLFTSVLRNVRVINTPVHEIWREGKHRGLLAGRVAHGNHLAEMFLQRVLHILGLLMSDVDPRLLHYLDRQRIQGSRIDSGAGGVEPVAAEGSQKPLRHLTSRSIALRKKEYSSL